MKVKELIEKLNQIENKELQAIMMHEHKINNEVTQLESPVKECFPVLGFNNMEVTKIVLVGQELI